MPLNLTASRAVQRAAIMTSLRTVAERGSISYADLSAVAGESILPIRHVLNEARVDLRDQDGIMFETIRSQGLRRMTSAEVALTVPGHRGKRAHSQATKGIKEMATVADPAALPYAERVAYQSGVSMLGATAAVTSKVAFRRIQAECARVDQTLTNAQTLRLFETIG